MKKSVLKKTAKKAVKKSVKPIPVSYAPVTFPGAFLWGSATSAFQVEGKCTNHDFYEWALKGRIKDKTNPVDAVFFLDNYKSDIALMKKMNHNAARIGIEWARIEPQEGVFDEKAIALYRAILTAMRKEKIAPMVTIHHFSNPLWLVAKGGWENRSVIGAFARYVEKIVPALGDLVDVWITINEPNIYAMMAYYVGSFPPGKKSLRAMFKVQSHMASAHIEAYHIIHEIHERESFPKAKVGAAQHLRPLDPKHSGSPLDLLSVKIFNKIFNNYFLDKINRHGLTMDVFGINYYSGDIISFPFKQEGRSELQKNKLGWDIYPEGLYRVITESYKKYHIPVYITENGTCDDHDELRPRYILDHLVQLRRAMTEGAAVAGYYHWSTMDNFELVDGFMSRFGLIHVDHTHPKRKRTIKPSGKLYGIIAGKKGIYPADTENFVEGWKP